jgi:hypothetical protein
MSGFRSRKRTGGNISRTAAKSYRRHRKSSHCHKKKLYACVSAPGCTIVRKSRKSKAYCRKMNNTRRRGRRGGGSHTAVSSCSAYKGGRRVRRGGLSPLSPTSFSSGSASNASDISGHFGAIVPGGPGQQGALPTAAHELSSVGMNALQVGESPSGATALTDPLRPKPFGGQLLPFAFGMKGGRRKKRKHGSKRRMHGSKRRGRK